MQATKCSLRVPALFAAVLIGPWASPDVFAQAAAGATDFSALDRGRTVAVVDDAGTETTGRLVRVTPTALTIKTDGGNRVFELPHVTTVHEVGDPLKNGMVIGLLAAGTLGIVVGASVSDCGAWLEGYVACTTAEKVQNAAIGGALYGAIGLGVGALVDKAMSGRTLRYVRPAQANAVTVSLAPSISASGARMLIGAAW